MPTIPKQIEIVLDGNGTGRAIRIDGRELDTVIGENVTITFDLGGRFKSVNIDLFAEDIRIVDLADEQS